MFKIKKLFKYSLLTIFITFIYIIFFGFHWTFNYDDINKTLKKNIKSNLYKKQFNITIKNPYIEYAEKEQFKVSTHITVNNTFLNFSTNIEAISKIIYKNGQVFLYPQKYNIDNLNAKKALSPFFSKKISLLYNS